MSLRGALWSAKNRLGEQDIPRPIRSWEPRSLRDPGVLGERRGRAPGACGARLVPHPGDVDLRARVYEQEDEYE